jgi:hypothetical protein
VSRTAGITGSRNIIYKFSQDISDAINCRAYDVSLEDIMNATSADCYFGRMHIIVHSS